MLGSEKNVMTWHDMESFAAALNARVGEVAKKIGQRIVDDKRDDGKCVRLHTPT